MSQKAMSRSEVELRLQRALRYSDLWAEGHIWPYYVADSGAEGIVHDVRITINLLAKLCDDVSSRGIKPPGSPESPS